MKIVTTKKTYDDIIAYEYLKKGLMILRHKNLINSYIILQKDFIKEIKEDYENINNGWMWIRRTPLY
jgi:hypothetical protein